MRLVSFSFDLSGSSIKDVGSTLRVESIPSTHTVHQLKQAIQSATVLDAARLSIIYAGQLMEDHLTIGHYLPAPPAAAATTGEEVAAQLMVAPDQHKVAVVVVPSESHGGAAATRTVRVRSECIVEELKDKICRKMGFLNVEMTIEGSGETVEDDSAPISRFGIGEGSQVFVREATKVSPR